MDRKFSPLFQVIIFGLLLGNSSIAVADDLHVPAAFSTIQEAIDEAAGGDHIHVAAGTYIGALDFQGKAIIVEATEGPSRTTLDVFGQGELVSFVSGEGPSTILRGFRIVGGTGNLVGNPGVLRGGAIYCENASPTLENLLFEGNTATQGGAIFLQESVTTVSGCTFLANEASDGGAVNISGGNPTLSGCEFTSNHAYSRGGAVHCSQGSTTVTGSTFQQNFANNGGGLWLIESTLIISACELTANESAISGGGMLIEDFSAVSIEDTLISNNFAEVAGGGIEIGPGSDVLVSDSQIKLNSSGNGGGIRSYQASLVVESSTIEENTTPGAGGGVLIELTSDGKFYNCIIRDNQAIGNGGGIAARSSSSLRMVHSTILDNGAGGLGGGVRAGFESALEMVNSISWGNTAAEDPGVSEMTIPVIYLRSLVEGVEGEPQVLTSDPLLDLQGRPMGCSPVIDEATAMIPDLPLLDIDGNPRVIGERPDMGAIEAPTGLGPCFLRGDCGQDGNVDLSDALLSLGWLFSSGEVPSCLDGCDNNDDGLIDLSDPILLLGYLFLSGPPPAQPFPDVGIDPTADNFRCWIFP